MKLPSRKPGKNNSLAGKRSYLLINLVLAGITGVIFIYSGIFSAEDGNHPLPSFHEMITGQPAPSSGMSRAFSEIIRGNLDSARDYNPDSLFLFAFFLIQASQRIAVSMILIRGRIKERHLLLADVVLSVSMFFYCFQGPIRSMFKLFSE